MLLTHMFSQIKSTATHKRFLIILKKNIMWRYVTTSLVSYSDCVSLIFDFSELRKSPQVMQIITNTLHCHHLLCQKAPWILQITAKSPPRRNTQNYEKYRKCSKHNQETPVKLLQSMSTYRFHDQTCDKMLKSQ